MSGQKNFILAYCTDNKNIADTIDQKLSKVGLQFEHIASNTMEENIGICQQFADHNLPVLLLVSDNFLKSDKCMNQALSTLQKRDLLYPVVLDGRYFDTDKNVYKTVPTTFDRVSNVIQYMNFWQEQYLDLRRKKRTVQSDQEESINIKLKITRAISSEVGEFLRNLRELDYWTFENLEATNYASFFKRTNNEHLANDFIQYANSTVDIPQETIAPPSIVEETINIQSKINEPEQGFEEHNIPSIPTVVPGVNLVADKKTDQIDELFNIDDPQPSSPQEEDHSIQNEHKDENPLLDKLIEYKKERMSDVPVDQLVNGHMDDNLDKLIDEVIDDEHDDQTAPIEGNHNSEDSYDLLDSIFNDDEDYEEELIETNAEDDLMPLESNPNAFAPNEDSNSLDNVEDDDYPHIFEDDTQEEFTEDKTTQSIENQEQALSDIEQRLHEAAHLIDSGKTKKGYSIFKEALEQDPSNIQVRLQYASYLNEARHYDKATKQLEKLLQYDPLNEEAYIRLAELAELHQDYILARSYYEKVALLNPNYPDLDYQLGILLTNHFSKGHKKAAKHFKKAIQKNKYNSDAHYRYAVIKSEYLGDLKKAEKHFKKTIQLESDHPFANYDLALLYYHKNKRKKAAKYYRKAFEINPELRTSENDAAFYYVKDHKNNTTDTDHITPIHESNTEEQHERLTELASPVQSIEKIVFITGATSGIGRATAEIFAKNGYKLIITGRRIERLQHIKADLREKYNTQLQILPFDVRNIESVADAINRLDDQWRHVDILINNAGLAKGFAPIHEGELEHWENMIDTNIKGLLYMTRAIAPYMVARQFGHIINIGSTAGKEVYPNGNVYCATKFAVDGLTKAMRLDLHKHNIRISQVSPGHVEETEFALTRFDGDMQRAKAVYNDFQPLKSSDVAEAIFFIATRPPHVNVQDVLMMGTQQAGNNHIHRSGRFYNEEEE